MVSLKREGEIRESRYASVEMYLSDGTGAYAVSFSNIRKVFYPGDYVTLPDGSRGWVQEAMKSWNK